MNQGTTNQSPSDEDPVSLVLKFLIASSNAGGFSGERPSHEVVVEAIRVLKEDQEKGIEFILALGLDEALREGTLSEMVYQLSQTLRRIDNEKALLGVVLSRIHESENQSGHSRILELYTGARRFHLFMMLETRPRLVLARKKIPVITVREDDALSVFLDAHHGRHGAVRLGHDVKRTALKVVAAKDPRVAFASQDSVNQPFRPPPSRRRGLPTEGTETHRKRS